MVCAPEAQQDLGSALGAPTTAVTTPTWADHVYSCRYMYPDGTMALSVKELSNGTETTNYFESIKRKYGTIDDLNGVGQGAWVLKNGDVVVRKDYKVLLVDVTGIPGDFAPAMRRSDVAVSIGSVIMSCWTGA